MQPLGSVTLNEDSRPRPAGICIHSSSFTSQLCHVKCLLATMALEEPIPLPSTLASIPSGILWTPSHIQRRCENTVVQRIHVVCYEPTYVDDPPTKCTNHWVFFLQTAAEQSLRVNPKPAAITNKLQLEIMFTQDLPTKEALFVRTLAPVQPLTVKTVLHLIKVHSYDKYQFNADGNGCRYWMGQFLPILRQAGKVANPDEVTRLSEQLAKTWFQDPTTDQIRELLPPRGTPASPGIFYQ